MSALLLDATLLKLNKSFVSEVSLPQDSSPISVGQVIYNAGPSCDSGRFCSYYSRTSECGDLVMHKFVIDANGVGPESITHWQAAAA